MKHRFSIGKGGHLGRVWLCFSQKSWNLRIKPCSFRLALIQELSQVIPISRIGNSSHISCSSLGFPALPDCPDCVIPNPIPASPNPIPAPGAAPAPRFPWEAPFVLPGIFLCGFFQGKLGKKGVVLIQGMVRALPELQKNGGNGKKILENALTWDFGISVQDSDPCGALPT